MLFQCLFSIIYFLVVFYVSNYCMAISLEANDPLIWLHSILYMQSPDPCGIAGPHFGDLMRSSVTCKFLVRGAPGSLWPRRSTVEIFRQKNVIFTRFIPVHEPG